MALVEIKDLSFAYPKADKLVLDDINLKINKGEFVLLCGQSGSGKTTLLRMLKPVLAPHGSIKGSVFYDGKPAEDLSSREQAEKTAFVMQDPDSQIVTDKVWHELAFGLENLGCTREEMRLRTAETAAFFGIDAWFYKNVAELSGGQKQLLNLAAATVLHPDIIVLDEPTSQLDPLAALEFINMLERINTDLGITVIISEHRLEELYHRADRVLVMDSGRIICDSTPSDTAARLYDTHHPMLCALPAAVKIGKALGKENCLTNAAAINALAAENAVCQAKPQRRTRGTVPALEMKGVYFKYTKDGDDTAKNMSFKLMQGELCAVLGGNGSGKTTALKLAAGILKPYRGRIHSGKNVLLLPQDPVDLFTCKTVMDDLLQMNADKEKAAKVAALTGIEDVLDMHPFDLSGGELQKAALAKLLLADPDVLLLDEPTKGLDDFYKAKLGSILKTLTKSGIAILMVSHDIEFCAAFADCCAMLFCGEIVSLGEPHDFFAGNMFYTTAASRISRGVFDGTVTADEVIAALGRSEPTPGSGNGEKKSADGLVPAKKTAAAKRAANKRTLLAMAIILFLIPLTIWFGMTVLNDRKYYFISMVIIFMTLAPFLMIFEDRIVRTRELMLIAMLCALACIGRSAFFMIHEFKPVCAVVIISGICLGAESGFMVGAVSGFVSNFFFGQGPWTPWQMFSFGIIGFLAGLCGRFGIIGKNKLGLALFGFLTVLFIYGGIMNPASVLMYQPEPTRGEILLAYARGIPIDLIHAAGTSVFLVLIGKDIIEKIERVKLKFGLIE